MEILDNLKTTFNNLDAKTLKKLQTENKYYQKIIEKIEE